MGKSTSRLTAIILAAGESTRLKSKKSKVLHPVAGKRCLDWVLDAVQQVGVTNSVVVLGKQAKVIQATLPEHVQVVQQQPALGTGHAVKVARQAAQQGDGYVFILCGDVPLISSATLHHLLKQHVRQKAQATVLTTKLDQPFGYGRIIRNSQQPNLITHIVEEKEASSQEKTIQEVNSGIYCFTQKTLWTVINKIKNDNKKGEYYLTDAIALLNKDKVNVAAYQLNDASELMGINTREELVNLSKVMNKKIISKWLNKGVTIVDPDSTWIDSSVQIGQDTVIKPGTHLTGKTKIGQDCVLGPFTTIHDSRLGNSVVVKQSVVDNTTMGSKVKIGPFAHLRPGNSIGADVKIGNFIELNRSQIANHVKIGHLGYIGDTKVEKDVNIGAGTITANYDGKQKHQTVIGSQSFIGSGSVLVAPNRIGKNSLTGAGAVVKAKSNFPANSVIVGVPAKVIKKRK